jgi:hypothetical protein
MPCLDLSIENLASEAQVNLSVLATLAGIVSTISVVISLLLIKRQIRHSDKNQRALIQQGRAGRSADIAMRLMSTEFAKAYYSGINGDSDISEIQLVQFMGYCRAVFLGAEDSFLQHRERRLGELAFRSFKRSLHGVFELPGMRAAWSIVRDWYDEEFVAFVDSTVKEAADRPNGLQHTQGLHERWKAAVSAEVAWKKAA